MAQRSRRQLAAGFRALVLAFGAALAGAATAGEARLLPAYSHNDYRNDRPLLKALELGYRGVEADIILVDGELRVAHGRDETSPGRTLSALYLEPLRRIVARDGTVLADRTPFQLNVEAKEPGRETYAALREELARYADLLTVVRDGQVQPGPVQVVLVGWFPPLAELAAESPRYAAVQCRWRDLPPGHAALPAHLLRLVSFEYRDEFDWQGEDAPPADFAGRLAAIRATVDAVPGRRLRVLRAPLDRRVYAALLAGGVDLIGTRELERTRRLLSTCGYLQRGKVTSPCP